MYEELNLNLLKKSYPDLYQIIKNKNIEIDFERNGKTLKIKNVSLFSKYDPEKEAENLFKNWVKNNNAEEKDKLLFLGISNPFLINKFIRNGFKIIIFIPNLTLFKIMIKFYDYSNIIKNSTILHDFEKLSQVSKDFNYIYILRPEEKLFKEKYSEISRVLFSEQKSKIKILLVKPFYGGSLPVANYCEMNLKKFNISLKTIEADKAYSAFNLISKTLGKKEFISDMRLELVNFISKMIFYAVEEFKPDIVFGIAQSPINEKVLKILRQKNITTLFWFVEDYKLFNYWKYFAQFYDYYFVIQKDNFFNELKKVGAKNFHYLALACEPSIHRPLNLTDKEKEKYGSSISFVGAGYYNRRKFFQKLINYDFKIWGSDWENEVELRDLIQENGRRISTEECVKIFNASLINLNLHSSTFYEGIAPDGDFINPRTFEIAACNSYQLVDRRKYLFEHFNENQILTFSNESELKRLIKEILNNPQAYSHIRENSYKKATEEHTYENRIIEIANILGFNLEKKKEICNNDKEFYFTNFDTLEEISEYIQKKEKITKTDAIFMLMKSLKDTYLVNLEKE